MPGRWRTTLMLPVIGVALGLGASAGYLYATGRPEPAVAKPAVRPGGRQLGYLNLERGTLPSGRVIIPRLDVRERSLRLAWFLSRVPEGLPIEGLSWSITDDAGTAYEVADGGGPLRVPPAMPKFMATATPAPPPGARELVIVARDASGAEVYRTVAHPWTVASHLIVTKDAGLAT